MQETVQDVVPSTGQFFTSGDGGKMNGLGKGVKVVMVVIIHFPSPFISAASYYCKVPILALGVFHYSGIPSGSQHRDNPWKSEVPHATPSSSE